MELPATIDSHGHEFWHQALSVGINGPLGDYLRGIAPGPHVESALSEHARAMLRSCVYENWDSSLIRATHALQVEKGIDALFRSALLFTGPHLQVVAEHFTLSGYLTALAFARATQVGAAWVAPCSSVRLQVEKGRGPGLLQSGTDTVNIFCLSTQQLKARRVCGSSDDLRVMEADSWPSSVSGVTNAIQVGAFDSPADFFHRTNMRILEQRLPVSSPSIVALDERLAGRVVAGHLKAPEWSPVWDLVCVPDKIRAWVRLIEVQEQRSDRRAFRHPTHHFWHVTPKGRLASLTFDGENNYINRATGNIVVSCHSTDLIDALLNGELVPSLFLSYFVLGYLPRIRLAGGVRQLFYQNEYWPLWNWAVRHDQRHGTDFLRTTPARSDHVWALSAFEAGEEMLTSILNGGPSRLLDRVDDAIQAPLSETSAGLRAIVDHEYFSPPFAS